MELIKLTAVVKGDPGKFSVSETKIREALEDADMNLEDAARSLCYDAPKYSRWTLDEDSIKIIRDIGLKMIEEMRGRLK